MIFFSLIKCSGLLGFRAKPLNSGQALLDSLQPAPEVLRLGLEV
jgi:hypothetical protein